MLMRCESQSAYGWADGELVLHLFIRDNLAARRVDQEDPARVQPLLEHDLLGRDVEDTNLGRHDKNVVTGHVVARRPQAVAVPARRRSRCRR